MEPYPNGFLSYTVAVHLKSPQHQMEEALRQGAGCWNAMSSREKNRYRTKYQKRYVSNSSTSRHRRQSVKLKQMGCCRKNTVPKCSRKPRTPACRPRSISRCTQKCSTIRSRRKCMLKKSPESLG